MDKCTFVISLLLACISLNALAGIGIGIPDITGQIIDEQTGKPLAGVLLLVTLDRGIPQFHGHKLQCEKVALLRSDVQGRWQLQGWRSRLAQPNTDLNLHIVAHKPGYEIETIIGHANNHFNTNDIKSRYTQTARRSANDANKRLEHLHELQEDDYFLSDCRKTHESQRETFYPFDRSIYDEALALVGNSCGRIRVKHPTTAAVIEAQPSPLGSRQAEPKETQSAENEADKNSTMELGQELCRQGLLPSPEERTVNQVIGCNAARSYLNGRMPEICIDGSRTPSRDAILKIFETAK